MRFENETVIVKTPANQWTADCFDIVRNYLSDLEYPNREKEIIYKHDKLEDVFKGMSTLISEALTSHATPTVAIVYHRDLDGGTSAIITAGFVRAVYNTFFYNGNCKLEMVSINYNDRLTETAKKILRNANLIISTDYSCSNSEHMREIFGSRDYPSDKKVIYIDHHKSSVFASKSNAEFKEFLNAHNVEYIIAERDNCSAALLTYLMCLGVVKNLHEYPKHVLNLVQDDEADMLMAVARSVPEYIMHVSLYDTFGKLAKREFSLGVNSIKHMPFELCEESNEEDIFTHGINCEYYSDLFRFFYVTISSDNLSEPAFYNRLFEVNVCEIPVTRVCGSDISLFYCIDEILGKGKLIMNYDISVHNMCRRKNEFEVQLKFDDGNGAKVYNVAVINSFGNSFLFEESYYNHDGVIMFTLDRYLNFVYSFYADKHYDNPNRLPCGKIAEMFGGGGHDTAAGCTLAGNIFDRHMHDLIKYNAKGEKTLDLTSKEAADFINKYVIQ